APGGGERSEQEEPQADEEGGPEGHGEEGDRAALGPGVTRIVSGPTGCGMTSPSLMTDGAVRRWPRATEAGETPSSGAPSRSAAACSRYRRRSRRDIGAVTTR